MIKEKKLGKSKSMTDTNNAIDRKVTPIPPLGFLVSN
jgi:hypothetical protein